MRGLGRAVRDQNLLLLVHDVVDVLRPRYDSLEIRVGALDSVLGVLLLALKALLALRVLLRFAIELLATLLEIVVGFSRQIEESPLRSCM